MTGKELVVLKQVSVVVLVVKYHHMRPFAFNCSNSSSTVKVPFLCLYWNSFIINILFAVATVRMNLVSLSVPTPAHRYSNP